MDSYSESVDVTNRFYRGWIEEEGLEIIGNLNERYQVFSYGVESRARALGQASNSAFLTQNRNLKADPLNYDQKHYSHSRQFRSNIVDERAYFQHIITDGEF